ECDRHRSENVAVVIDESDGRHGQPPSDHTIPQSRCPEMGRNMSISLLTSLVLIARGQPARRPQCDDPSPYSITLMVKLFAPCRAICAVGVSKAPVQRPARQ